MRDFIMKDNIILRKIWQDDDVIELAVVCSSPLITATSEIYVSDSLIDELISEITRFLNGNKEGFWANEERGDASLVKTAVDVVGSAVISEGVNSLTRNEEFNLSNVAQNITFSSIQSVTNIAIGRKAPTTISGIKKAASKQGVKGTKNLNAYLRRTQSRYARLQWWYTKATSYIWAYLSRKNESRNGRR